MGGCNYRNIPPPAQIRHWVDLHHKKVVLMGFFSCFFQYLSCLCEFVRDTAIKGIVFPCSAVCLFFLLTITGKNEAIVVELKMLFVLNSTFITSKRGSHH